MLPFAYGLLPVAYSILPMAYCLLVVSELLQSSQVCFMDMLTGAAANTNIMTCGMLPELLLAVRCDVLLL